MNFIEKFDEWGIDLSQLTEKKQQTNKKIEYVRDYIIRWSAISAVRADVNTITFIDCMSNAGVYRDGDCCTAIEVLKVFTDIAEKYPEKTFRVLCNDIKKEKIDILKIVSTEVMTQAKNVQLLTSNQDVNDYLGSLEKNPCIDGRSIFGYGCSTVLYVDPFDFGTVEIPKLTAILEKHYCELIFNFFVSDYVRNISRDQGRIQKCLGGYKINNKDELFSYMRNMLRVGHIKHLFSYEFRITNNVELYQIVFATPNKRGLEVLKESLWAVFDGAEYHRNKAETGQLSFFSSTDIKKYNLDNCSKEAKMMLHEHYSGKELSFDQIEEFLIENTMLGASQIISNVIKPMIADGQLKKIGLVSNRNFKQDRYLVISEETET